VKRALAPAFALFVTLEAAKAAVCLLRAADGAPLGAARLLGVGREEALVALGFALVALALSRLRALRGRGGRGRVPRVVWIAYGAFSVYAAVNVPVTRVFASPLTASMCEATSGALADSIARYVTLGNVAGVGLVLTLALTLARASVDSRVARASRAAALALAPVALVVGFASPDVLALHRDPVLALASTELVRFTGPPRATFATAAPAEDDASTHGLDLTHLARAARGRHVVWIVLESTGARYLRPYGATDDATPNLTRLAAEGITFENAYAVYPESIKGLYAMLCSFAPASHTAAAAYDASRMPCVSIAETLQRDGYATGLWHSGRFAYLGMSQVVGGRGFDVLADARTIGGKHASSFGTDDMSTARAVLARLDARRPGERLLVTYMPISGHHPYESPGEGQRPFGETTDIARYKSDLYRGDLALGALVDGLRARGLYEETLFVIHGDHGEAFLQHEGNFAHTMFAYDENLHVPFVVVAPGLVSGPIRARQLVSLLDVAPTIADLIGAPIDPRWQGRSALSAEPRVVRALADATSRRLALRTGRLKLVLDADADRAELFDLAADPGEEHDLSRADPAHVAAFRGDLLSWSDTQRAAVDAALAKQP
jgi:hypothetical protein